MSRYNCKARMQKIISCDVRSSKLHTSQGTDRLEVHLFCFLFPRCSWHRLTTCKVSNFKCADPPPAQLTLFNLGRPPPLLCSSHNLKWSLLLLAAGQQAIFLFFEVGVHSLSWPLMIYVSFWLPTGTVYCKMPKRHWLKLCLNIRILVMLSSSKLCCACWFWTLFLSTY